MAKKKNTGFKCKHMQKHEFDDLMTLDEAGLNKEFVKAKKNERAAKKQIKDNDELNKLKEAFKIAKGNHENSNKIAKKREEVKILMKELLDSSEVSDAHLDYKALKEGFDNTTKGFTEKQKAILYIMAQREFNR